MDTGSLQIFANPCKFASQLCPKKFFFNAFPFFWVKWVYHKLYIFQFQIFDTNWPSLLYSMINVAGQIKWRQSQIFCHLAFFFKNETDFALFCKDIHNFSLTQWCLGQFRVILKKALFHTIVGLTVRMNLNNRNF